MSSTKLPAVIWVMVVAAGLGAANLHYSQPLLPGIASTLGVTLSTVGLLPALTQCGFALGIFFLLPLSDLVERKRLIVALLVLVSAALLLHGLAPTTFLLLSGGFLVGLAGITPQLFTPFAAMLAPEGRAGSAVGLVLSGVLTGVLLSKVLAGMIAVLVGWRDLYLAASLMMLLLAIWVWFALPASRSENSLSYRMLLMSTLHFITQESRLRRNALNGGLTFAAFMAFWSTYALWLWQQHHLGPGAAGLFGLAGMAGALAASFAGRAIDRGKYRPTVMIASLMMVTGFVLLSASGESLLFMVVGLLLLDGGAGICHAANQSAAFAIDPSARGRLNSAYMCGYFIGGALGTAVATHLLLAFGWFAVCGFGVSAAGLIGLLEWFSPRKSPGNHRLAEQATVAKNP